MTHDWHPFLFLLHPVGPRAPPAGGLLSRAPRPWGSPCSDPELYRNRAAPSPRLWCCGRVCGPVCGCGHVYREGWSNPTPPALLPGLDIRLLPRGDKDDKQPVPVVGDASSGGDAQTEIWGRGVCARRAVPSRGLCRCWPPWAGGHSLPHRWLTECWDVPSPIAAVICLSPRRSGRGPTRGHLPLRGKQTSLFNISPIRLPAHRSDTARLAGAPATFRSRAGA